MKVTLKEHIKILKQSDIESIVIFKSTNNFNTRNEK